MSRTRGTYSTLENWALDLAPTLPGAAGWVLLKLAAQVNYKRKTMTIGQLIDALPYKERSLQQACAHLVQAGYVLCADGAYVLRGACTPLAQDTRRNVHPKQAEKADSDDKNTPVNSGMTEHNQKESEEREETEEKTPLTPQGEPRTGEGEVSPVPAQPMDPTLDARPTQPTDPEKVPRRRAPAAPAPALPEDLAALPGVQGAWDRWLRYRAEARIKTPATTADEQFRKLRDLHAQGWDLPRIVAHAIEVGWKSFFPIRGEQPRQNLRLPPHDPAHADPDEKKDWLA